MKNQLVQQSYNLDRFVKRIWHCEVLDFTADIKKFKVFPDGMPGLLFQYSEKDLYIEQEKLSTLFLYGQTLRPFDISYVSGFRIIIFFFHPSAVKTLFGIDANELVHKCIDYDLIDKTLKQQLLNAATIDEQIKIISAYILKIPEPVKKQSDDRISFAVNKILSSNGQISLNNLRNELFITERTFERKFLQHVGITPSSFTKICRFNSAINHLNNRSFSNLSDLAYAAGYADQSHFIRNFKEFTTMTPTQYVDSLGGQIFS